MSGLDAPPRPFAADAPILVAGPPGSGKTTVGRLAAERLAIPFHDLDQAVEDGAGRTVAAIFAAEGEAGFRAREAEALNAVLARPGRRIVALGGGALVDPRSRAASLARAVVVQLRAPVEVLAARVERSTARPLLAGSGDLAAGLRALVEGRREAYAEGHLRLDATRPPAVIAGDLALAVADRFAWVASRHGGYPVRLARDGCGATAEAARGADPSSVHLIADARVLPTWAGAVGAALAMAGIAARSTLPIPSGEEHKRLATVEQLAAGLLAAGADRGSVLVAAGGGVTSDMTGLLAALFFRGIPWIAAPTTLLSMVDAAVGGKTAVDLDHAKNVLGAFHPPVAVVVDPAHARTEPARQIRAGLAEAVKTALVGDPRLLELLEEAPDAAVAGDVAVLEEIVARALAVKVGIVSRDEHEGGERAHLNLGHTFGHALEAAAGWDAMSHGEAVAVGLVAALRVGEDLGLTERGLGDRVTRLLRRLGLPTSAPPSLCEAARALVASDKKRVAGSVRFVALTTVGAPVIRPIPMEMLASRLAGAASGA